MASTDNASDAAGPAPDSAAVGAVTPPLDHRGPIPGRRRARSPFAASRLAGAPALALAGLLAGTMLAAALVLALVVLPADREHAAYLADARADLAAAQIETVTASLRAAARRLATAPETTRALRLEDPEAVAALEARYTAALDGALRVRLNATGRADIALTEVPPLTFAGLDLIRSAESGGVAGPEYLATEAGPLLNVAAGVPGGGDRAFGTVLVTWSADHLTRAFGALPEGAGRFALLQTFGSNPPVEVAGTGRGEGAPVERALSVRNWTLVHEPPAARPIATPLGTLPAWIALLASAAAAILVAHRRLGRFLRADLERLVDSAHALALGRPTTPPRDYALDESAAAGAALQKLAGTIEAGAARRAAPPPIAVRRPSEAELARAEVEVEELTDEDDVFLDIDESDEGEPGAVAAGPASGADSATATGTARSGTPAPEALPPAVIFRDYDIRGIVGEQLTEAHARLVGRAVASAVAEAGERALAVAGDCRLSTPALKAALVEGVTAAGVDVVDIGEVPTPVLYHSTHTTGVRSGVVVTGSHSAPAYNGFKIVIGGRTLGSGHITELAERIREGRFTSGAGSVSRQDAVGRYVDEIAADIALAQPLRVVVDCGNGIAGVVAPRLLKALGCEVLPLYCDPDGTFPNHHPDPADPDNLEDLATVVRAEGADLGIALDGDGDRIGAVDERGAVIWPDRLLMLFARDIVGRNPGTDVVFDVKCSRHLNHLIAEYGGRPIMWKTGHSNQKAKMRETGALLGGELSGHISFGERWHTFDDGLYAAARLLEIVAGEALPVSEIFAAFPPSVVTPEIRVPCAEAHKFAVVRALVERGGLDGGDVSTIDGLRVDFPDGWGLVRASNTAPALTLRFEADTVDAIREIADRFRRALRAVDPALDFEVGI